MSMAVKRYGAMLAEYLKINLKGEMEFRASFISQVLFMILNDVLNLFFWYIFFSRFKEIRGYGIHDVLLLWSISASSFGLATAAFGNSMRLHRLIADGQLDYYLTIPKDTLFHVLASKMSTSAWGDFLFGLAVAVLVLDKWSKVVLYIPIVISSGVLFISFGVILGSLAFWMGSSEGIFSMGINAVMTFSLYPESLFSGLSKFVLYTLIPAGFITYIPIALLHRFNIGLFLALAATTAISAFIAIKVFYRGLKRYESGNSISMRT